MAKQNSPAPIPTAFEERDVLFHAQRWPFENGAPVPGHVAADFVRTMHDVTQGTALILKVLHQDQIDCECAGDDGKTLPSMFSMTELEVLRALCISTLTMAAHEAEKLGERLEAPPQKQKPVLSSKVSP